MFSARALAPALLVVLLPASISLAATERGRPFVEVYPPGVYDGSNQIWSVAQTGEGLLLFGERSHILVYDGARWRKIDVPVNNVRGLAVAPDGRIYVGGSEGLGFAERDERGAWVYRSLNDHLPPAHNPPGNSRSAHWFRDAVYFTTARAIHRWAGGRMRTWDLGPPVWQWADVLDDALYVFRQGRGLMRLRGDEFELVSAAPEILATTRLNLFRLPDGGLGNVLGDGRVVRVERDRVVPFPTEADELLRRGGINIGARLRDGSLVLATDHDGVVHLARDGRVLGFVDTTLGLDNQSVLNLGQDREGNVWLCTNSGLARVEFGRPYTVFDRRNGLGRDAVESMARFAGALWAGAWDGLYRLEPGVGAEPARFARVESVQASVWALQAFGDQLLVATSRGLLSLDGGGNARVALPAAEDVLALTASRHTPGLVLVGRARGLSRLRLVDGAWRDLGAVDSINTNVRTIVEDAGGNVWLGTRDRGIFRVSWPADGGAPLVRQFLPPGSAALVGYSAAFDVHGEPRFHFEGLGVHRFDPARDGLVPDDAWRVDGKVTPDLSWLTSAPDGAVWAWKWSDDRPPGMRRALGRFVRAGGKWDWQPLPARIANTIGTPRVLRFEATEAGGVLWANGTEGTLRVNLGVPMPAGGELRALVRRVHGSGEIDVAPRPASTELRLPATRDRLNLEFASPTFFHGNLVRFRTRLLGFDDRWSDWQPEPAISFTNLEGGPFTLEVQAHDTDGRESPPGRVRFTIAAPWHRTGLAYAGYVAGALGAVAGFVRWRLGRAERERQRLETIVAQRTAELKVAKDAADQANRAKSAFLASMSHELRTPLNGVIGYAQILQRSPRLAAEDRDRIQIMQASGEHLLRMINEVLDLSKIEAGKLELSAAPFHLPQLLRDVAANLAPRAQEKGLEFRLELPGALPDLVLGDAQKLRQVLDNLLSNAVKFTARGVVELRVELSPEQPSFFRFVVRDTGAGISAADRARLFQPFQQAAEGRPPEPGTGLGLAISKRIADLMGGTLAVESEPGAGSTFTFAARLETLATHSAAPAMPGRLVTGYRGPRQRVLVVDDIGVNRAVLLELLQPLGFELRAASNGEEALRIAAEFAPHLVFLDLRMPGMNGLELARHLRERTGGRRLKLIAMSASVLSFNRDDAFAAGCDDFLPKPFREADLLARIGEALSLEWIGGEPPREPLPAGADGKTSLPTAVLEELLGHARRGEIGALRARLAPWRGDPLADALDPLARAYRMEDIRNLLGRHASARTAS